MSIPEKIDLALYEFSKKNPIQPSGILMHPHDADELICFFRESFHERCNTREVKYRGIDIYRSDDAKEKEIKLIY
jgi:hypothetical protein